MGKKFGVKAACSFQTVCCEMAGGAAESVPARLLEKLLSTRFTHLMRAIHVADGWYRVEEPGPIIELPPDFLGQYYNTERQN